ncbi:hypothetical protein J5N97_015070 [Dioscorea zingiberensis]|uniref:60S ribosomal protein L35a n=1 Tax=Dioscorea zingiberensis TaxID=325984 RepID=A0A9D5CTK2_9LILI|nr:hypothetical protein J5N97_015070 [Dioscorea zingiberensis]
MVKGRQGERVRLYVRGTILGYKRSKSNQQENTSLLQIEGVNTKEEVAWSPALTATAVLSGPSSGLTCRQNPWAPRSGFSCIPATSNIKGLRQSLVPAELQSLEITFPSDFRDFIFFSTQNNFILGCQALCIHHTLPAQVKRIIYT